MKRILLILMTLLSVAGADACKPKKFQIDFCGQEYAYAEPLVRGGKAQKSNSKTDPELVGQGMMPARTERKAGEEVVLYFLMVATDTDYRFVLDGEQIQPGYEHSKGYIIRFTMPEHDVKLQCQTRNSMSNPPGEWH